MGLRGRAEEIGKRGWWGLTVSKVSGVWYSPFESWWSLCAIDSMPLLSGAVQVARSVGSFPKELSTVVRALGGFVSC